MAGHSQFKNIMFRKGKQDKERSKLFAKLSREITVAAKSGLPDPAHNPRLRTAIIAAKAESMPKDNIERAIQKAVGGAGEHYDEIRYEGRGPGGVALIVEAMTDNRNRTSADVRAAFSKYGGGTGALAGAPLPLGPRGGGSPPPTPGGAERRAEGGRGRRAHAARARPARRQHPRRMEDFAAVRDALEARLGAPQSAAIVWRPQTGVAVPDEQGETLMKLIEVLDDHDDVQNVYGNYELSDALITKLAG